MPRNSGQPFTMESQNVAACFFFILAGVAGMFYGFESKFSRPMDVLLHVKSTMATLDNEYTERRSTKYGTSYDVSYAFKVDGKEYKGRCPVSDKPQIQMEVFYMPDNPSTNGLELRGHAMIDLFFFIVPMLAALIPAIALFLHFKNRGKVDMYAQ